MSCATEIAASCPALPTARKTIPGTMYSRYASVSPPPGRPAPKVPPKAKTNSSMTTTGTPIMYMISG